MTNQEMFNQKLKELGYDDMPEGILLIGEKKEELLEFINNNSKGGYSISADGKISVQSFPDSAALHRRLLRGRPFRPRKRKIPAGLSGWLLSEF